jgi:hypothetical protein
VRHVTPDIAKRDRGTPKYTREEKINTNERKRTKKTRNKA